MLSCRPLTKYRLLLRSYHVTGTVYTFHTYILVPQLKCTPWHSVLVENWCLDICSAFNLSSFGCFLKCRGISPVVGQLFPSSSHFLHCYDQWLLVHYYTTLYSIVCLMKWQIKKNTQTLCVNVLIIFFPPLLPPIISLHYQLS